MALTKTEPKSMVTNLFNTLNAQRDLSYRLRRLAQGFYLTGNYVVGDDLNDIAESIDTYADKIRRIFNDDLDAQLKTTRGMSSAVLESALAGIAIANREG
jgi:hypothetical protein